MSRGIQASSANGPDPAGLPAPIVDAQGASALLGQVLRQSPIGIAVIGDDGRFLEVNPAYCRLYGWSREQMLGRPFTMVVAPGQRAALMARHRDFMDHGAPMKGEFDVLRADGQALAILVESVRLPSTDGRDSRLVYVVDITPRRRIELALKGSRQFLHAVLDGLSAHVCVLDEGGTILAVNRAWRDFARANGADGAVGATLHEGASYVAVCERARASGRPDGAEAAAFLEQLQALLAGQRERFELDYPCHSADRQRWFVVRASRMASPGAARIVLAHDDVSALKQVQDTLGRSEALLRDMAASLPGAMFRLLQGAAGGWRFTYFSAGIEPLFGLTPEQACADLRALTACILPEDLPAHDASIRRAVAEGRDWVHDYRIRSRDGQIKWVHARASPKPGAGGDTVWTGVLTDVSERMTMALGLQASEERYRTLFETVPQGVVYHDTTGRITSANPAAQRILGLSLAQLTGMTSADPHWQALREDGTPFPVAEQPATIALRTGQPVKDVVMGVAVPGRERAWLLVNATPLRRNGQLEQVYASFEDITERVLLSQELRQQASTDFLTGLANRRQLMERLTIEVERVQRHPGTQCCVLSVDLDHFKRVNDERGHAAGDAVLRHVAAVMKQGTRQIDLVARSGGEEFTLLLPDTTAAEAGVMAERLRACIAGQPTRVDGHAVELTASIGIARVQGSDTSPDAVLARADAALYAAKGAGRNCVRLAADTL